MNKVLRRLKAEVTTDCSWRRLMWLRCANHGADDGNRVRPLKDEGDDLRKKSANYQIVGTMQSQWGALFAALGDEVAVAPPVRPNPLTQDGLLDLFDASETGGNVTLEPATDADMRGKNAMPVESLEVIYDAV